MAPKTASIAQAITQAETAIEVTAPKAEAANQPEATTIMTAPKAAASFFGAVFTAGRTAVAGVIEVDRTLIGYARDAITGYVELGKKSIQARNLNDLLDLHVASAHARVENTAANAREIVELSRQKLEEAYAPVKEIVATYRGTKAA